MKILEGPPSAWERPSKRAAATIGVYDGVHRGHHRVIADLRDRAAAHDLVATVVTFREHPVTVLAPERVPPQLTTLEQKLELFRDLGVDQVALLEFDDGLRHLSPDDFVERILVSGLDVAHVAVGEDFRFGYQQQGNVERLGTLGVRHDFSVTPVTLVGDEQPFSATGIRVALAGGDLATVEAQLGRRFQIRGVVVHGDGRGRQIGFATANLELHPHQALPAHGVYAVRAGVQDPALPGVANIGVRPTFDGSRLVVEVHLLDVDVDLYGAELHVDLVAHVRSEQRFGGVGELVAQIAQDVQTARELLLRTEA